VAAERAAELAELALGDEREMLTRFHIGPNYPLVAWTLAYADRLERADELFSLAVDNALAHGSLVQFAIASGCRCHVRLHQGRIAEAEAEAEARSTLEAAGHAWAAERSILIACLLDTAAERGERDRALALAHDELRRARVWGTPSARSLALRAAGIVTGGEDGIALLREAADVVADSPARYERVRSLVEYGAASRGAQRRRLADIAGREQLEAALEPEAVS